ncbi:MAG: TonB-dependent receptor [Proteobacteria bacterium]|nr:TonB-dependent receptor [Pseudomonadota bacterium]
MYSRLSAAALVAASLAGAAVAIAGPTGLEEIVVTAQRKEESAQNIGVALSVISGDSLKALGVSNVNDLQNTTPSLEVEPAFGSGQAQFRLRGVGFIDYTANNSSPVGVNLDEVPLPFPVQTQGQLFDVARVEVLRGPQGTLYGRNTTGGAVNFVTNRPTDEFHAGISARYGTHNLVDAEGFVSGPLADKLKGRISWAVTDGGAWQRNRLTGEKLGKQEKYAGRVQLQWDPTENFDLRLNVHLAKDKSDANGLQFFRDYDPNAGQPITPARPIIPADSSPYLTGWSLQPSFAQTVGISPGSRPGLNNSNNGVDLTAQLRFDGFSLTSITAYNKLIRREFGDWDASQYAASDVYFRDTAKVFSQEVRVASAGTGAFGWLGGVYYSNEKFAEDFFSDFNQSPLVAGTAHTSSTQDGKSLGVFGQTEYRFAERWKAIVGLRYEHESRDLNDLNTSFDIPGVIFLPTLTGPQNRSLSTSDVSGRIGLEYRPADEVLLYGTISRGVKSGGYNIHNTTSPLGVGPFQPEKLLAYELGIKSDVTPTLRLNASVFYYDYKDQQVLSKTKDPVSQSYIGVFVNAPKSEIHGGEVEATWRPIADLRIEQYLGYKEGKFKGKILNSDESDPTVKNFDGHPIDFPKLSYGGEVAYDLHLGSLKLTPSINYDYHDTYRQLFLLGPDYTVDSYWLANANLTLAPSEGKSWSAGLWVHNVFGTRYDVTKNFFLPGSFVALAGQPTTVGIQASYSF